MFVRVFMSSGLLALMCQPVLAQSPKIDPAVFTQGVELYQDHCAVCHGAEAQGDGPLASGLVPRPRDLTMGSFKFSSTPTGEYPTEADLMKTLSRGITGSFGQTMPAFDFLTEDERFALVEIIRFVAGVETFGQAVIPSARPATPDLAKGQALFQELQCAACHGATGDGNGQLAADLTDENQQPIKPANLRLGQFKGGNAPEDVWMRIYTGISGTPMPAFGRNTTSEDIWEITEYVLSLKNADG